MVTTIEAEAVPVPAEPKAKKTRKRRTPGQRADDLIERARKLRVKDSQTRQKKCLACVKRAVAALCDAVSTLAQDDPTAAEIERLVAEVNALSARPWPAVAS